MSDKIELMPIGVIHTPYKEGGFVPRQPLEREDVESTIEIDSEYEAGLADLAKCSHIYVIFYLHKREGDWKPTAHPPWAKGKEVGVFASRSPRRPNPIGLSLVKLRKIEGNVLFTDVLDAYDGTPVIDIKPYFRDMDAREDANNGWAEEVEGYEHQMQHLRGLPHDHSHDHGEGHSQGHEHDDGHGHDHHHGEDHSHSHHHGHDDEDGHDH